MIGAVLAILLLLGVAARPSVSAFATVQIIGASRQTRAAVRRGGGAPYSEDSNRPLSHPSRIGPCLHAATEPNNEKNNGATTRTATTAEMEALERQVRASARETVDWNRVLKALEQTDNNSPSSLQLARNDLMYEDEPLLAAENNNTPSWTSHLQVAAAAGLVTGAGSYVVLQNYYISLSVAGFVFVTAFLVDDDDNNLTGALARILGRRTLQSVQATQPRVRALARAVVTGEAEIGALKEQIRQLEREAAALRRWKEQRIKIDRALPRFKVEELRAMARDNELVVKGTKLDLLVRLVEADVIELD